MFQTQFQNIHVSDTI